MMDMHEVKVLRAVRLSLDPEVETPIPDGAPEIAALRLESLDIMEVEATDGTVGVIGCSIRSEGSFDPATDPAGPVIWNRHPRLAFEKVVAVNVQKETKLGALKGEPTVLVAEGSPVMWEVGILPLDRR